MAAATEAVSKRTKTPIIPGPKKLTVTMPAAALASKSGKAVQAMEDKTSTTCGVVGISRSAVASRKLEADMDAGTHTINMTRQQNFKYECLVVDSGTQFRFEDKDWLVFHFNCGKWQKMTEGYASNRFRTHVNKCGATGTTARFTSLTGFFKASTEKTTKTVEVSAAFHPCSGITEQNDAHVPTFIRRTGANGGGTCSVTAIAMEVFGRSYGSLSSQEKLHVDKMQMHEWSFRFDRRQLAVYSTTCEKMISIQDDTKAGPHTCETCLTLCSKDQRFKSGLRVTTPDDGNYRHLNEKYQGKSDGERYAKTQGLQTLFEDKVYPSLTFSCQ